MGFFKNILDFIKGRLNKNIEIISKSFGTMIASWVIALFGSFIALASGLPPNWGVTLALGFGGTSQFLLILIRTAFGKPDEKIEEVKEGLGNI